MLLKKRHINTSPLEFPRGGLCGKELWVWPVSEQGIVVS